MTKIRPLLPPHCPDCGAEKSLFIDADQRVTCRLCRYKGDAVQAKSGANTRPKPDAGDPRDKLIIKHAPRYMRDPDRWALTKFSSAMSYADQKAWDSAIIALKEAIDQQPDFIDAHLWLARFSQDDETKRHHYEVVLSEMPKNLEAIREMMVLKGELTREEADRISDTSREQTVMNADYAVKADLTELVCSNCGGSLDIPAGDTEATCLFCGHIETVTRQSTSGMELLTMALLKERAQGVKWRVGEYLLHCDNCGAERIISKRKMRTECPFCGSDHVVKTDALGSFRQPDGIVPFKIGLQVATENLEGALNSFIEKFKGLFINNRVDKIQLTPVYLPFWVFDVLTDVSVSGYDRTTMLGSVTQSYMGHQPMAFSDNIYNLPYCAVKSPPRKLTRRLTNFDFEAILPYDPKRLATVTAEIYSIDYEQAAIDIRPDVREILEFRHINQTLEDKKLHLSYMIQGMAFRLVLLPVWAATITEVDEDVRLGLVHGQSGQVVIGKARKAQ